jgi:hypothetical protein
MIIAYYCINVSPLPVPTALLPGGQVKRELSCMKQPRIRRDKEGGGAHNMVKNISVAVLGIISLLYLLNPGMGFIEVIQDYIPFAGNLDEGGAAILLLMCLRFFGLDLTKYFVRQKKRKDL